MLSSYGRTYEVTVIEPSATQGANGSYVFSSALNAHGEFVILVGTAPEEASILLLSALTSSKLVLWLPEPNYGLEAGFNEISPTLDLRSPQLTDTGEIIASEWERPDDFIQTHEGILSWNAGSVSRIPLESIPHGISGLTPTDRPIVPLFRRATDGDYRYSITVTSNTDEGSDSRTRFCRWSGSGEPSLSIAPPFENDAPKRNVQKASSRFLKIDPRVLLASAATEVIPALHSSNLLLNT